MQLKPHKERYFLILEYDYVTWKPRIKTNIFFVADYASISQNLVEICSNTLTDWFTYWLID